MIQRNGFKRRRNYSPSQTPFLHTSKQTNKSQPTNYTNPAPVQDPAMTRSGIYSYVEVDRSTSREQLVSPYEVLEDSEDVVYATTTARERPQWPRVIPSHNSKANGNGVHTAAVFPESKAKDRECVRNGSAIIDSKVANGGNYDFDETLRSNGKVENTYKQTRTDFRLKPVPIGKLPVRPGKPHSNTDRVHPYEISEIVLSQNKGSKLKIPPRDWSTLPKEQYEFADEATPNLKSPFGAKLKPIKARKRQQDDPDIDPMYATPHTRQLFEVGEPCTGYGCGV